ncbi:MAG: hypothetical protein ACREVS_19005 [Burkholderiales bacterium]
MKRIILIAGLAAALAAAGPALAQSGTQGRRATDRPPPTQPMPPPARPADMRGERDKETPRGATMTPDERRDLRRDIRDHGREVYRDSPNRPPQR